MPAFMDSRISMDLDIFRYVLISLTYFGHNLGTKRGRVSLLTGICLGDNIRVSARVSWS